MQQAAPQQDMTAMFFEDFRVGQRFVSPGRTIAQADIDRFTELSGDASAIHIDPDYARSLGFASPLAHGPLGVAVAFGLQFQMGLVDSTAIAMLDLDWSFRAPFHAGDELALELTVTRCRRSKRRPAGIVNRHFRLVNGAGVTVQEGTSVMLVRARGEEPEVGHVQSDFASLRWARLLAPRLSENQPFVEATQTFDGTIGLQAGRETVQLRVYKSRVLECARTTPHGPTFMLAGSEMAWLALISSPRNDFIARATAGEFSVRGDTYEYLRLTKALVGLWDSARELAEGAVVR